MKHKRKKNRKRNILNLELKCTHETSQSIVEITPQ
jgi:hypothetical protein